MEEEVDLRPYVIAVVRRWRWIIAAFVIPVIAIVTTFSFRSAEYEATAIVAYVAPADVVQFDARFAEGESGRPLPIPVEKISSQNTGHDLIAPAALPVKWGQFHTMKDAVP